MSATRTGALIIFERDNRLDDQIRTGTILDAETTAELLKNIFYPKAPLHDGRCDHPQRTDPRPDAGFRSPTTPT